MPNVQRVGFHNQDRILPGIHDKASVLSCSMLSANFRGDDFWGDVATTLGTKAQKLVNRYYFRHVQISQRAQVLKGHRSLNVRWMHCAHFRFLWDPIF